MTKDEKNRAIAEWLGFKHDDHCGGDPCMVFYPAKREWIEMPDFYLSEEASALVLDKLGESNSEITFSFWSDSSIHVVKHGNRVSCFVDLCRDSKRVEFRADAPDRKTAIAEAALALIQSEKEQINVKE